MHKNIFWIIFLIIISSLLSCRPERSNQRAPLPRTPVTSAPNTPFCSRTQEVQTAIMEQFSATQCSDITPADLNSVIEMDLSDKNIRTLQPDDFVGLTAVTHIYLDRNQLTSLPVNIFYGLNTVKVIDLDYNKISQVTAETFTHLPALRKLRMRDNPLSRELKEELREKLSHLDDLELSPY